MINKLPKWVEIGGFFLAAIAGSVNAIALLGFNHQGVSHLTGSSTQLGIELVDANTREVVHLSLILCSFILGAAVSGFVIGNESLRLGRRYSVALFMESGLLLLAMYFLNKSSELGHYLASAACGLQNAMTSTYSGATVRTTHLTGLFTDLGIMAGLRARGQVIDKRRVVLYFTLIGGFIIGAILGAVGFGQQRYYALVVPAALASAIAVAYLLVYRRWAAEVAD